ncbi:unnamed protein product, partial [Tenebrio molitor]
VRFLPYQIQIIPNPRTDFSASELCGRLISHPSNKCVDRTGFFPIFSN